MRSKIAILVVLLVLALALGVLCACGTNEQSLEGMVIVTFMFNGGVLDNSSTNVVGQIQHAYQPDSYVIDVSHYKNYSFTRSGYVFEGWYKDDQCTEPWNFATDRVSSDITLYAKWELEIVYSYGVYLVVDGKEPELLGSYRVKQGDTFNDSRGYGTNLTDRTFLGFYSDKALTQQWDTETTHPGGEQSCEIPVYVKSIEGKWTFVSNYDELVSAKGNIMLTADIDCGNNVINFGNFNFTLQGRDLDGNDHRIYNFRIANSQGRTRSPEFAIFNNLGESAQVLNVTFDDFTVEVAASRDTQNIKVAAFAITAHANAKVENVTVNGTYTFTKDPNSDRLETTEEEIAKMFAKPVYGAYDKQQFVNYNATITQKQD